MPKVYLATCEANRLQGKTAKYSAVKTVINVNS
jgi:hypothetical protein